jgi:preprotein translocase subunit YajC
MGHALFGHVLQIRNAMFISQAYAQVSDGASAAGGGIASFLSLAPLLLVFIVFYFLMIRPQQKRMKAVQASIAAVKKNDSVVTAGGIVGKVTKVEDAFVEVEIAPNTRVRVVKATLTDITSPNTKPAND